MQRNWDLIRVILLKLEDLQTAQSGLNVHEVEHYDAELVSYHVQILIEAGIVDGHCSHPLNGPPVCAALRLTWEGHEFLDRIRQQGVWNKIKGVVREKGLSLSLDVIKFTSTEVIKNLF